MPQKADPGIVNPMVEKYMSQILRPRDKILQYLEKDARENSVPIIGPLCGNVLSLIATGYHAKNILEIGTATGYSGIWLARVAKKNSGKLITIEMDRKRLAIAQKSFSEAGVADNVKVLQGDAKEIVPKIAKKQKGRFDVVFEDVGDKSIYVDLLEPCIDALRVGGYLIADNSLWSGRVALPSSEDKDTNTIRKFNKLVYQDKRLLPVIIPLRDGMTVCLKTGE
ncbi:MAG TPA: O-methyltransferase [Nitrososphaerales archaeon]|nr:O-methyltransferase [Nitrososphaerales archaeon]